MFRMLTKRLEVIWRVSGSMRLKRIKMGFLLRYRSTGLGARSTGFAFIGQPESMHFWTWAFFTIAVDRSQGPIDRSTADLKVCFVGSISAVGSLILLFISGFLFILTPTPNFFLSLLLLLLLHSTITKNLEILPLSSLNLSF